MSDEDLKVLLVRESVHRTVKAQAALAGVTIQEWVERALLASLTDAQRQEVQG